ncbi:MAG: carbohydrate binding domain-containing protein [Thermodesulfobacteriota bacterium]
MILRVKLKGKRLLASFIILSFALLLAWLIVKPLLAERALGKEASREELLRALSLNPANPSYHYRLGLFWHYDPAERDLDKALEYYINAINLSPTRVEYWLELSSVYEDRGALERSEESAARAVALEPFHKKARWVMVNLQLRRGQTDKALKELGFIIKHLPGQRLRAFSLARASVGGDTVAVVNSVLSGEFSLKTEYLLFLMRLNDSNGVLSLWKILAADRDNKLDSKLKVRYVEYLISNGYMAEAEKEWARIKGVRGARVNLVWNGGFEDGFDNAGFDWRATRSGGVKIDIDGSVRLRGKSSVKIEFDGSRTYDFRHLSQTIPLEPNTGYTFSAGIKTLDIKAGRGLYMEFYGTGGCKFFKKTEPTSGTNDWKRLEMELSTPKGCTAGIVRLRSAKSKKPGNFIRGSAWIDEVRVERNH